jgi:hypothetical protein
MVWRRLRAREERKLFMGMEGVRNGYYSFELFVSVAPRDSAVSIQR